MKIFVCFLGLTFELWSLKLWHWIFIFNKNKTYRVTNWTAKDHKCWWNISRFTGSPDDRLVTWLEIKSTETKKTHLDAVKKMKGFEGKFKFQCGFTVRTNRISWSDIHGLPKWIKCINSWTNRLKNSFIPTAIMLCTVFSVVLNDFELLLYKTCTQSLFLML